MVIAAVANTMVAADVTSVLDVDAACYAADTNTNKLSEIALEAATAAQCDDVSSNMVAAAGTAPTIDVVAAYDAPATLADNMMVTEVEAAVTAAQSDVITSEMAAKEKMRKKLQRQKKRDNKAFKARISVKVQCA